MDLAMAALRNDGTGITKNLRCCWNRLVLLVLYCPTAKSRTCPNTKKLGKNRKIGDRQPFSRRTVAYFSNGCGARKRCLAPVFRFFHSFLPEEPGRRGVP